MKSEAVSGKIIRIKWGQSSNYRVGGKVRMGNDGEVDISAITVDIDHYNEFGVLRYVIWVKVNEMDYVYKSINEGSDGLELTFDSIKDIVKNK